MTFPALFVVAAIFVIEMEDVLVAIIVSSGQISSSFLKSEAFISKSSEAASIARKLSLAVSSFVEVSILPSASDSYRLLIRISLLITQ